MSTRPRDTTPASGSGQTELLGRMGGAARVRVAVELSEAVRELRLAGIRARSPEMDDREAVARLIREDYGVDLPPAT